MTPEVFILDRITVRPGRLGEYQALLRERYLPLARARGMTLVGQWFTPPIELDDAPNDLVLLWSVPGPEGFWTMRRQARDPEITAWWAASDALTLGRERKFMLPGEVDA